MEELYDTQEKNFVDWVFAGEAEKIVRNERGTLITVFYRSGERAVLENCRLITVSAHISYDGKLLYLSDANCVLHCLETGAFRELWKAKSIAARPIVCEDGVISLRDRLLEANASEAGRSRFLRSVLKIGENGQTLHVVDCGEGLYHLEDLTRDHFLLIEEKGAARILRKSDLTQVASIPREALSHPAARGFYIEDGKLFTYYWQNRFFRKLPVKADLPEEVLDGARRCEEEIRAYMKKSAELHPALPVDDPRFKDWIGENGAVDEEKARPFHMNLLRRDEKLTGRCMLCKKDFTGGYASYYPGRALCPACFSILQGMYIVQLGVPASDPNEIEETIAWHRARRRPIDLGKAYPLGDTVDQPFLKVQEDGKGPRVFWYWNRWFNNEFPKDDAEGRSSMPDYTLTFCPAFSGRHVNDLYVLRLAAKERGGDRLTVYTYDCSDEERALFDSCIPGDPSDLAQNPFSDRFRHVEALSCGGKAVTLLKKALEKRAADTRVLVRSFRSERFQRQDGSILDRTGEKALTSVDLGDLGSDGVVNETDAAVCANGEFAVIFRGPFTVIAGPQDLLDGLRREMRRAGVEGVEHFEETADIGPDFAAKKRALIGWVTKDRRGADLYELLRAHRFCENNRRFLEKDGKLGCFNCLSVLTGKDVTSFSDGRSTARCPYCGGETLLPEKCCPTDLSFLAEMRDYWLCERDAAMVSEGIGAQWDEKRISLLLCDAHAAKLNVGDERLYLDGRYLLFLKKNDRVWPEEGNVTGKRVFFSAHLLHVLETERRGCTLRGAFERGGTMEVYPLNGEQARVLQTLVGRLEKTLDCSAPDRAQAVRARAEELLLACEDLRQGRALFKQSCPVVNYIDAHLRERLTLSALCAHFHINRTSLSRAVKDATGLPPNAYILDERLRRSLPDVLYSSLRISEIAARCGFEDDNYFVRAFKRKYGEAPLRFRRKQWNTEK